MKRSESRRKFLKDATLGGLSVTLLGLDNGPVFAKNMNAHTQPTQATYLKEPEPVKIKWLDDQAPITPYGVSWGVPWPRSAMFKDKQITVQTPDGKSVPTQSWPLAYWPDGSVKWSGVAIAANPGLPATLTVGLKNTIAPASPLVVKTNDGSIEISTGVLKCNISRKGTSIVKSLMVDGREVARDGKLVAVKEDRSEYEAKGILREKSYVSNITSATVEQSGPVRAVVCVKGMHANPERAWLPFTLRFYFTAGLSSIRIVHSFVFDGDENKDFIKGLGLSFSVPFREEKQNRHIRFATDGDGVWAEPVLMSPGYRPQLVKDAVRMNEQQMLGKRIPNLAELDPKTKAQFETIALWDSFKLSQLTPGSFSIDKRTNTASSWLHATNGIRSRGFVFVGDVSGGVGVGVKHFWEKYPSSLEVTNAAKDAAELKIWLWSPDAQAMDIRHYDTIGHDGTVSYEDHQDGSSTPYGIANTSELTLWALGNTPKNKDVADMAKISNEPPLLVCTPEYYHQLSVFGAWSLPDRSMPDKAAMETQLDRAWTFFSKEVEQRNWYGFWDFGDFMRTYSTMRHGWLYDIGGHAWNNTELMADAWLWYTFLRTGRADAFRLAENMTRSTSEVDVYHIGRFAGIGSRHNVKHWGDGAKELRISEAYLKRFYYYLTTDERTGDLMREVLTADENIPNALPLRKGLPRPEVPIVIRTGPDWIALASNWMTEWERTGDVKYRDYVLAGMRSIGAMPQAFASRIAMGYDIKTKRLYDIGEPNIKTYEFVVLFGGDQIAYEMMQLISCPEFEKAWNELYEIWAKQTPGPSSNARITAYMARITGNPEYGHKAWQLLRESLQENSRDRFPAVLNVVAGSDVSKPVTEIPGVNTPGASQWALNIITATELARNFYKPL